MGIEHSIVLSSYTNQFSVIITFSKAYILFFLSTFMPIIQCRPIYTITAYLGRSILSFHQGER